MKKICGVLLQLQNLVGFLVMLSLENVCMFMVDLSMKVIISNMFARYVQLNLKDIP